MNKKLFISALALSAFILVACGGKTKQTGDKAQLSALTVGVMSSMEYLPLAVAQQQGYFKENGLEVTLQKFYSPNERDAAIQSGNLDGSILDYTGAAIQNAKGVEIYLTSACDGTFEFIVGKNSNIQSIKDLKGKSVAVSRNTVIDFCTEMALAKAGLTTNDIKKEEINKIPLRLEMLRNSKIDAAFLPDPFATIAKSGDEKSIFSLKETGMHITGLVFTKKAIQEKSEAIKAFYKAYNQAVNVLKTKPVAEFAEILKTELGFPEPMLGAVTLPDYSAAVLPAESDLETTGKWLKEKQLVPADFDMKKTLNSSFVAASNP